MRIIAMLGLACLGCTYAAESTPPKPAPTAPAASTPPASPAKGEKKASVTTNPETHVITVVGQEPLNLKPASETTLSGQTVKDADLRQTRDLKGYAPNLVMQDGGDRATNFVGMRGQINGIFGDPAVGISVDGAPLAGWRNTGLELLDVESIEVKRGPQATDVARNSSAGAIEIKTKDPSTNAWHGSGAVAYGDFNQQYYTGSASGAIKKDLAYLSIAGVFNSHDGYLRNEFLNNRPDGRAEGAGRVKLRITPIKSFEIDLTGEGSKAKDHSPTLNLDSQPRTWKVRWDTKSNTNVDTYAGQLRLKYDLPLFTVSSNTARRNFSTDQMKADLDLSPVPRFQVIDEQTTTQWTNEFRVDSKDKFGPWKWTAGTYFEDRQDFAQIGIRVLDPNVIGAPTAFGGLGLPFVLPPVEQRQFSRVYERTYAAFGQATYTFLEKFDLTFGLRYETREDKVTSRQNLEAYRGNPLFGVQPFKATIVPQYAEDNAYNVWLPKLAFSYRADKHLMAYTSISRGYQPGGFSTGATVPTTARFTPAHQWTYEVGTKSEWFDQKLSVDASLFWSDINDYQLKRIVAFSSATMLNTRHVTSRGFELSLVGRPLKGLELGLNGGYTDSFFEHYYDKDPVTDFSGRRVPLIPLYNFMAYGQYRHSTGFFGRVEWQGTGPFEYLENNQKGQNSYELFNARLGYERNHWGVYLYGKNLFNREYFTRGYGDITGADLIKTPGDPRTFGIMGTFKF